MIAIPRLNVRKWPLISSVNSVEFPPIVPFAPRSSAAKNAAGRARVETTRREKNEYHASSRRKAKTLPHCQKDMIKSLICGVRSCDMIRAPPVMNAVPGIKRRCSTIAPMMVA